MLVLRILFPASNNVAEYEACLHGIRLAVELGVKRLYVYGDSALVINQLNKEWDTTHEKMDLYCKKIRKWEANFYGIEYMHVVQDKNQAADALSKIGSSRAQIPQAFSSKTSTSRASEKTWSTSQTMRHSLAKTPPRQPTATTGARLSLSISWRDRDFKIRLRMNASFDDPETI